MVVFGRAKTDRSRRDPPFPPPAAPLPPATCPLQPPRILSATFCPCPPPVIVLPNGPLLVRGPCELVDREGVPFEGGDADEILLCRCGQSATKPFCDQSHARTGFREAGTARDLAARAGERTASACRIVVNPTGALRLEGDFVARRLGSAARRLGGSAARRLGGSAARRLGGSAARRLGGSAARRLGGSAPSGTRLARRGGEHARPANRRTPVR